MIALSKFTSTLQRVGQYVKDWGRELEAQTQAYQAENRSTATLAKRPASSAKDSGEPSKRAKPANDSGVIRDEEMKAYFENNTIGKVRAGFLLFSSGIKAYLADRVRGISLRSPY